MKHLTRQVHALALGLSCCVAVGSMAVASPDRTSSSMRFSGDLAYRALVDQVRMGPRVPGTPGHDRTLAYIENRVRGLANEVRRETFFHDGHAMTNLVARLAPGRGSPVLVAAHWDTRRWCDQDLDPRYRDRPGPGANDGASGASVLIELARVLSSCSLTREVRLVWLDGEDWGRETEDMFLGARAYVARHRKDPPMWGLLLDMVGEREVQIPREAFSQERAPVLLEAVFRRARELGLSGTFPDRSGEAVLDDHLIFLDAGIPVVDLIDFDYPEWHTHSDTPRHCAPSSLERVGALVLSCLIDPVVP
jgi:hypothetical protein